MADSPEIKVTLTAEDQGLSAALRELSEQLKTVDRSQQQLASGSARAASAAKSNFTSIKTAATEMADAVKLRLANIPGLGGLGSTLAIRAYEPIGKLAEQAGTDLEETLGAAAGPILGITAAVVALGVAAAATTKHMMDMAQSIENTAAATGLSTAQVQELTEISKEMDVDAGSLEMAFARVETQIGEYITTGKAAGAGTMNFARVMNQLGVEMKNTDGTARTSNQVLADFYDALQKIPDQATRTALEMEALGTRGRVIAQVFEEARREGLSYRDMLASIDSSGVVIPDSELDNLMEAKRRWDELTRSLRGYLTEIEGVIAYATTHPVDTLKGFLTGGAIGGAVSLTTSMFTPDHPEAASSTGGENAAAIGSIKEQTEALQQQLDVLKAGSKEKLELQQAEAGYAAAVKAGHKETAAAYAEEIADLKQVIALEAEKHEKKKKDFDDITVRRRKEFKEPDALKDIEDKPKLKDLDLIGIGSLDAQLAKQKQDAENDSLEVAMQRFELEHKKIEEGTGSPGEKENAYLRLLKQEVPLLEKKAQLQLAAAQLSGNQKEILQAEETIQKINQMGKQAQEVKDVLHNFAGGLTQDFSRFFEAIPQGARGITQAFGQMELGVIRSLENIAAEMLANLTVSLLTDDTQRISNARTAATNVFKWVSDEGPLGWILAPIAAASTFAQMMAYAKGGLVEGPGGPTADLIPARLSAGEFVMNAGAVKSFGAHNLEAINAGVASASPSFAASIAHPSDFRAPSFQLPDAVAANAGGVNMHNEITLQHHGPDAREVLDNELAPRVIGLLRNGVLPSFG